MLTCLRFTSSTIKSVDNIVKIAIYKEITSYHMIVMTIISLELVDFNIIYYHLRLILIRFIIIKCWWVKRCCLISFVALKSPVQEIMKF